MTIMHSLYRESGRIAVNQDLCTVCGACSRICPSEALILKEGKISVSKESYLDCFACGHCMMACPTDAISVSGRGISPEDLRPMPDGSKRAGVEALSALMQSRRSTRRFSSKEVDSEQIEQIVAMAAMAPMGIPPWDVGCIPIQGRKEVKALAAEIVKGFEKFLKIFKPWLLKAMRPFIGQAKYEVFAHFIKPLAESYVQAFKENRDIVFYDAPALLIFHHSPYAEATDAMIACTYAMLAAESMGLGSTMIGAAAPIIQRNKALSKKLGIPAGNKPSILLILGNPAIRFQKTIHRQFLN